MYETNFSGVECTICIRKGGIRSSEELKYGMSDNPETGSNDDHGFSDWAEVDSITATQDALAKTPLLIRTTRCIKERARALLKYGYPLPQAVCVLSQIGLMFQLLAATAAKKKLIKTLRKTFHVPTGHSPTPDSCLGSEESNCENPCRFALRHPSDRRGASRSGGTGAVSDRVGL